MTFLPPVPGRGDEGGCGGARVAAAARDCVAFDADAVRALYTDVVGRAVELVAGEVIAAAGTRKTVGDLIPGRPASVSISPNRACASQGLHLGFQADTPYEGIGNKHPHSGASYSILKNDDATFGVEVSIPDSLPTVVSSFPSEAEAERWIAGHQKGIASGEYAAPDVLRRPSELLRAEFLRPQLLRASFTPPFGENAD